jgi:hypothetical protein
MFDWLVGKDVHVLVEDADLTVEAVPILRSPGADEGNGTASADASATHKNWLLLPNKNQIQKLLGTVS